MFDWIIKRNKENCTVFISAGNRTTKITPKTYQKFIDIGKPLFLIDNDGLRMLEGKNYNLISTNSAWLVKVTARKS